MMRILTLCLLLAFAQTAATASDSTTVVLSGYVKDDAGKGIKGVVVNNGTAFATTDRKGLWKLATDTLACRFISISVPADYQLPTAAGAANGYYKDLRTAMSADGNTFVLTRRTKPVDRLHYIAISDPQLRTSDDMKRWTTETVADLARTADSLRQTGEVVAVTLGDLVFDNMSMFDRYKATLAQTRMPVYQCIGNHDFNKAYAGLSNLPSDTTVYAEKDYCRHFGPTNYSFNIGRVHVVTINSISYAGNRHYKELIAPADLEWLRNDLSYVEPGTLVLLNTHAPAWCTHEPQDQIENADSLKAVFARHITHLFCGHTHFYENVEASDSLYQHNIGAACGAWWTCNMNRCGAPNGYLIADIEGTRIKWRYKATNRPADYQMKVYKPGEFRTQNKYVVANVWDYDSHCRMAWYQDGKYMGRMEQVSDYDEMFLRTKPLQAQIVKTSHLFRAMPTGHYKTIKVVLTNRFGQTFEHTIVNPGQRPAITDFRLK